MIIWVASTVIDKYLTPDDRTTSSQPDTASFTANHKGVENGGYSEFSDIEMREISHEGNHMYIL